MRMAMNTSSKYARLNEFLVDRSDNEIELSFAELERILGSPLPESASVYPAWWANQTPPSSQSSAWMSEGWRAYPNLKARRVTFRKEPKRATIRDTDAPRQSVTRSAELELQEDQVKEHLRAFLEMNGWRTTIASGKARGIDIEAFREGHRWIIEVKGCGSLSPMRVNYFLGALGELLQRMNDPGAKYRLAFPDLAQFRGLWQRLPSLAKERTGITCLFVHADGEVSEI